VSSSESHYDEKPMSRAEARNKRVVFITCPTRALARRIARAVVQTRLAACVNIVHSPVESFYTWKGKLEKAREYLLIMKTTAKRLAALENEVKRLHTYDVPEFIALPISQGSKEYLSWLNESVASAHKNHK
jgi:periplasmic divalent cation tolerance protein